MDLQVAKLLLDTTNPRIGTSESQRDAINALIRDGTSQLLALAGDILTQGILNPAESPVVVYEGGHHVVIEGNRRLACLKLLRNPDLADDPRVATQFRTLAKRGRGPDKISVWVAPSRGAAVHWLQLRHTGENAGVGVRAWNSEQQVRFSRNKSSQATRAVVLVDALETAFADDEELLAALLAARGSLTTLGRVVSDPDVRRAFGFDFHGNNLIFHHDRRASRIALLRLLGDIAKNSVGKFMSKNDRSAYVQEAKADLPSADSLLPTAAGSADLPKDIENYRVGDPEGTTTSAEIDRGSTDPIPLKKERSGGGARSTREDQYIYEGLRLKHVAVRTKKTLNEAQAAKIDDAPHVCAVMLRVVLELVLTEAGLQYQWFQENVPLDKKVVAAIQQLDPDYQSSKANPELKNAYNASARDRGGVGIIDLHAAVHSFDRVASTSDVRARSADFRPLLVAIDAMIGQNR